MNTVTIDGVVYERRHIGYDYDRSPLYRLFASCGCWSEGDGSNRQPCYDHERAADLAAGLAAAAELDAYDAFTTELADRSGADPAFIAQHFEFHRVA